jgi:PAS domain S-box-containing protein
MERMPPEVLSGFNELLDLLPDVQIWVKDRQGRFLACSRAFLDHFGFERPNDLAGRTDFDFAPQPLAREYVDDDGYVLSSGKSIRDKMELVRERDGSLTWYSTSKVPLRGPGGAESGEGPGRGLDRAVRHIESHYGEDLRVGFLADLAGMSVDTFERKFRKAFRETPLRYLNRIRMRAACGLLMHTEMAIAEVARQSGFSDPSYFSRRFRAHLRINPADYRRRFSDRRRG